MQKLISYIVGLLIVVFSTIPPIDVRITAPGEYWPWMVLLSIFGGLYLCFLQINPVVKLISVYTLINCFFSTGPVISFTAYFLVVACGYFYFLCTKVEDWEPIFKFMQTIVFLNLLMTFMQIINKDVLLNFHVTNKELGCFGSVGQHMQTASFSVILSAFLISFNPLNFIFPFVMSIYCQSAWGVLATSIGLSTYLHLHGFKKSFRIFAIAAGIFFVVFSAYHGKFQSNTARDGRLGVWSRTINLANEKPINGYGIGSYKYLFPALSQMKTWQWVTAHNDWIQYLFELGRPFFIFIVFSSFLLMRRISKLLKRHIYRNQAIALLSGLAMIAGDMMVHFPTRMSQCVLIMIAFLAYCEFQLKRRTEHVH